MNPELVEVVTISAYYHYEKKCPFPLGPLWEYRRLNPKSELAKTTPCELHCVEEFDWIYKLCPAAATLELSHYLPLLGGEEHAAYMYDVFLWRCKDFQCNIEHMLMVAEGVAPSFRMALIKRWWEVHQYEFPFMNAKLFNYPWAIQGNHRLLDYPCEGEIPRLLKLGVSPQGRGRNKLWWRNKLADDYALLIMHGATPPEDAAWWLGHVMRDESPGGLVKLRIILRRLSLGYICRNASDEGVLLKHVQCHLLRLHGELPDEVIHHKILPYL